MPRAHRVEVRFLPGCRGRVPAAELRRLARAVMSTEGVASTVQVEVALAGADTVRDLNRLYRGRDEPTDVLSFAAAETTGAFVDAPGEAPSLGEVVVCLPIAEAQAQAAGNPLAAEVAHLLVHGLLHLLGYDHEEPAAGAAMKAREDAMLGLLGYAGRYAHGH